MTPTSSACWTTAPGRSARLAATAIATFLHSLNCCPCRRVNRAFLSPSAFFLAMVYSFPEPPFGGSLNSDAIMASEISNTWRFLELRDGQILHQMDFICQAPSLNLFTW